MASDLTWPEAIQRVLRESSVPLHYGEIAELIAARGLRTSLGATPARTVCAVLGTSIKKDGVKSPYVRGEKGHYWLARFVHDAQRV